MRTGPNGANGISVLVIPLKNTEGVSVRRIYNSGLNASGSTFISFEHVKVTKENLIGKENEGFKIIMSNFNAERLSLATGAIRLARTCFIESYNRASVRRTFGYKLLENQVIRAKLASMARGIESCHAWIERLSGEYFAAQRHRVMSESDMAFESAEIRIGAQIALVKVQSGRVRRDLRSWFLSSFPNVKVLELCCREAQQIFGGLGYSKEGPGKVVEQISRDLRVFVVGGGSEEIMDDLGIRVMSQLAERSKYRL